MKRFLLTAVTLSIAFTASADDGLTCFKALNPSKITITNHKNSKKEVATLATAKLATEEYNQKRDNGQTLSIDIKAASKTMRFSTLGTTVSDVSTEVYNSDCDGGNVNVKKLTDSLILLNSDRLSGEVRSTVGCASGDINFKDLVLEKVTCK